MNLTPRLALRRAAAAAAAVVLLAGCGATSTSSSSETSNSGSTTSTSTTATSDLTAEAVLAANEDATTVNEDEWSIDDAVEVTLYGTSASTSAEGVTVDGSTVTITAAGVYRLSGILQGQVVVDAPEDALVVLVLDGVEISSDSTAAISVISADDVAVHLADGSENTLSDTDSYAEDAEVNAALFSEEDLTISGTGSLTVTGNGNDGITSEDDLVVLGGEITVEAADDALRGKDSLTIEGGTLYLTAGGDGLKSDNEDEETRGYVVVTGGTVSVSAADDGLDAITDIVVTGGTIEVAATGGETDEATSKGVDAGLIFVIEDGTLTVTESVEAIEAGDIAITGGEVTVTASDDGLNASNGSSSTSTEGTEGGGPGGGEMADTGERLIVSGGTLVVDAEGDGLDSNGSLTLTGGSTTVFGPTNPGNGAVDSNGEFTVTGGTLLAVDAGGMAQAPGAASTQGFVFASVTGSGGDVLQIADADGDVIAEITVPKGFSTVVFSSADVANGDTYQVVAGSSSTEVTAGEATQMGPGGGAPPGR